MWLIAVYAAMWHDGPVGCMTRAGSYGGSLWHSARSIFNLVVVWRVLVVTEVTKYRYGGYIQAPGSRNPGFHHCLHPFTIIARIELTIAIRLQRNRILFVTLTSKKEIFTSFIWRMPCDWLEKGPKRTSTIAILIDLGGTWIVKGKMLDVECITDTCKFL